MARLSLFLLQTVLLFGSARALDVTGHIAWNTICQDFESLGHASVWLDEGVYYGSVTQKGEFTIPNVPDGTYLLSVQSQRHSFDHLRIDIANASAVPVEGHPHILGTPLNPPSSVVLQYPIILTPKEKHAFFTPHESFNLGGMLSNPMMLMMIGLGAFMLLMPFLMKSLDPDMLEDMKREQAKMHSALSNGDLKGMAAIMTAGDEAPQGGKAPAPAALTKGKSGKKGKR